LPPAHVGLHAGPVLFQEGDYFGQTVNLTARIADYARPGEVLVSQAVADASHEEAIAFATIGPVELKGVVRDDAAATGPSCRMTIDRSTRRQIGTGN
jgi:class 3 adenylate cyclase